MIKDKKWLKEADAKELVNFYNKKMNATITKFSSRAVAEQRILKLLEKGRHKPKEKTGMRRNGHGYFFNGRTYDRIIHLPRPDRMRCAKLGTKIDALIKILQAGATMGEILLALNSKGKNVDDLYARNWFNWSLNSLHGYGVGLKDEKYYLIYPKGIDCPLPNQLDEIARTMLLAIQKNNKEPKDA